jgi:hypothetical protein
MLLVELLSITAAAVMLVVAQTTHGVVVTESIHSMVPHKLLELLIQVVVVVVVGTITLAQ